MSSVQLRDDEETNAPTVGRLDGVSIVISAPDALSAKLASGLEGLGSAVAVLGDPGGLPDGVIAIPPAGRTREEAMVALSAASARLGRIDAVICAPPLAGPRDLPFAHTDEEAWIRGAEAPIWETLVLFQAAYAVFGEAGGSLVAIVPTIAITGAAGFVAFAAAAEGIRQLVKSAARAWGRQRTRVNCLAVPIGEWGVSPRHPVPNRYGASLPGANAGGDLAGAAALLISPLAGGVTGATIGVDRGAVLAP